MTERFPVDLKSSRPKERLLFLYSAPTGGHRKCADALIKAFKTCSAQPVETIPRDAITYLFPLVGPIVAKAYLEILRYTPQIWDFLYDNPDIEEITRELRQLFNLFNGPKLKALLNEQHPTALICTHAIPCGLIAEQKKAGHCRLPLVAVITDYAVHSYWIYPEVDLYLVPNAESEQTLLDRGIPRPKIRVTGIPIDPLFLQKKNVRAARKKLGLDLNKPVILVMGGARGLGQIVEIAKEILSIRLPLQLLVVGGTNELLKKEMSVFSKFKNFQFHGYSRRIPTLMDAADLLVTKPGGMTCSEALAKELPMILIHPIPGQEERNARYLTRQGVAVQVRSLAHFREIVRQMVVNPQRLEALKEQCRKISRPDSAQAAVLETERLLERFRNQKQDYPGPLRLEA